jgi:putative SOS response-associated peptidase YedK
MCGRYTLAASPIALAEAFAGYVVPDDYAPRYNIAPTQPVLAISIRDPQHMEYFRWGLIPSWSEDFKVGNRLINAQAETASSKPSFRAAFRKRRCLVLADGFYEWRAEPGQKTKTPIYIRMKSEEPFAFAGLWEQWEGPDPKPVLSSVIITTPPNALIKPIHDRMPAILAREDHEAWLDSDHVNKEQAQTLLKPYPADQMKAHPVSTIVNSPTNEVPDCIKPAF